jgi:hypothetical protein
VVSFVGSLGSLHRGKLIEHSLPKPRSSGIIHLPLVLSTGSGRGQRLPNILLLGGEGGRTEQVNLVRLIGEVLKVICKLV